MSFKQSLNFQGLKFESDLQTFDIYFLHFTFTMTGKGTEMFAWHPMLVKLDSMPS